MNVFSRIPRWPHVTLLYAATHHAGPAPMTTLIVPGEGQEVPRVVVASGLLRFFPPLIFYSLLHVWGLLFLNFFFFVFSLFLSCVRLPTSHLLLHFPRHSLFHISFCLSFSPSSRLFPSTPYIFLIPFLFPLSHPSLKLLLPDPQPHLTPNPPHPTHNPHHPLHPPTPSLPDPLLTGPQFLSLGGPGPPSTLSLADCTPFDNSTPVALA